MSAHSPQGGAQAGRPPRRPPLPPRPRGTPGEPPGSHSPRIGRTRDNHRSGHLARPTPAGVPARHPPQQGSWRATHPSRGPGAPPTPAVVPARHPPQQGPRRAPTPSHTESRQYVSIYVRSPTGPSLTHTLLFSLFYISSPILPFSFLFFSLFHLSSPSLPPRSFILREENSEAHILKNARHRTSTSMTCRALRRPTFRAFNSGRQIGTGTGTEGDNP